MRYVTEIKGEAGNVKFYMEQRAPVDVKSVEAMLKKYDKVLKFSPTPVPCFTLRYRKYGTPEKDCEMLFRNTNTILNEMGNLYTG